MSLTVRYQIVDESLPAKTPSYSSEGAAGLDLYAAWVKPTEKYIEFGTNLAFEIPEGHVGLIFPRSSISKKDLRLANSVGVIDSDFRGEVTFRFKPQRGNRGNHVSEGYEVGDKIGQMIILPYPTVNLEPTNSLSSTERGSGGYGSTGDK